MLLSRDNNSLIEFRSLRVQQLMMLAANTHSIASSSVIPFPPWLNLMQPGLKSSLRADSHLFGIFKPGSVGHTATGFASLHHVIL